eukprot:TRINITY_DN6110_c0_g1_i1.p1 TRINITY_DN6110_c0_g1~~TRINITY_DN6110_c0_g1_i1.p1  ORF type:complete len:910 (-),score=400.48 TRINITY_DN6110_c0_g1_i1:2397-5126(-)
MEKKNEVLEEKIRQLSLLLEEKDGNLILAAQLGQSLLEENESLRGELDSLRIERPNPFSNSNKNLSEKRNRTASGVFMGVEDLVFKTTGRNSSVPMDSPSSPLSLLNEDQSTVNSRTRSTTESKYSIRSTFDKDKLESMASSLQLLDDDEEEEELLNSIKRIESGKGTDGQDLSTKYDSQVKKWSNRIKTLQYQFVESETQRIDLLEQYQLVKKEIDELKRGIREDNEEKHALRELVEAQKEVLNVSMSNEEESRRLITKLASECKELRDEANRKENLSQNLNDLSKDKNEMAKKLEGMNALKKRVEELEKENKELEELLKDKENLGEVITFLADQNKYFREQLTESEDLLDNMKSNAQELQIKLESAIMEASNQQKEYHQMEVEEIQKQNLQLEQLERDLEMAKTNSLSSSSHHSSSIQEAGSRDSISTLRSFITASQQSQSEEFEFRDSRIRNDEKESEIKSSKLEEKVILPSPKVISRFEPVKFDSDEVKINKKKGFLSRSLSFREAKKEGASPLSSTTLPPITRTRSRSLDSSPRKVTRGLSFRGMFPLKKKEKEVATTTVNPLFNKDSKEEHLLNSTRSNVQVPIVNITSSTDSIAEKNRNSIGSPRSSIISPRKLGFRIDSFIKGRSVTSPQPPSSELLEAGKEEEKSIPIFDALKAKLTSFQFRASTFKQDRNVNASSEQQIQSLEEKKEKLDVLAKQIADSEGKLLKLKSSLATSSQKETQLNELLHRLSASEERNKKKDSEIQRLQEQLSEMSSETNSLSQRSSTINTIIINNGPTMGLQVTKSGWLTKKGAILQFWRRRYFFLSGVDHHLYYSKDQTQRFLGSILLSEAKVRKEQVGKDFGFTITISAGRTYFLAADSAGDMEDWINSIQDRIDYLRKSTVLQNFNISTGGDLCDDYDD